MAQDINRVCTGRQWVQRWFGQLYEKLHLDAKKTWQCLKVELIKQVDEINTSLI